MRARSGILLPLCCALLVSPVRGVPGSQPPTPRTLTFADRVAAQERIERVYYAHQIDTTRPFEAAVPRAVLEEKVRTYLKQSLALETFWKTRVTAAMLRAETERMTRDTRLPDRLRELKAALGDDPLLVRECLARPALVDRLVRRFYASDGVRHAAARYEAESLRADLVAGRVDPGRERAGRDVVTLALTERESAGAPAPDSVVPGHARESVDLAPEDFRRWSARMPARSGEPGALIETRAAFILPVVLERSPGALRVTSYVTRKLDYDRWWKSVAPGLDESRVESIDAADAGPAAAAILPTPEGAPGDPPGHPPANACSVADTWDNGSLDDLPEARDIPAWVWTGSLMIVWGGRPLLAYSTYTGGRYDPAIDTWSPVSRVNAPFVSRFHTAVWTGSEMIVWGGLNFTNSGGRYNPTSDTWSPTSTVNAPEGREGHSAVWTGTRMIVWGGVGRVPNTLNNIQPLASGGRYDPASDTWSPTSAALAPVARAGHSALWTGSRMLVWGGGFCTVTACNIPVTGGRYDPASDSWSGMSTSGAPPGRFDHTAVWSGHEMLVWGGADDTQLLGSGARYDPAVDAWTPIGDVGAPVARAAHAAVWTGDSLIVWGGACQDGGGSVPCSTGGRYDPATDAWTPTSNVNAPSGRIYMAAVWSGSLMVVWGGSDDRGLQLNTGGRYDPGANAWTPTATTEAPEGRLYHSAIWTGNVMVVWGGQGFFYWLDDGSRYDPALDQWSPIATSGAPSARQSHTAVWTGQRMLVWGGWSGPSGYLGTGARYDPIADLWSPLASTSAPSPRASHTALWTGREMIVWGGGDDVFLYSDGGRYDPTLDTWTPTSLQNAPSSRGGHAAVWTGSNMLVWGGSSPPTGGRYDPATDTWTPIASLNAPFAEFATTAVWTGKRMIAWGGAWCIEGECYATESGGLYDPQSDTWIPTSLNGTPGARIDHSAVWTANEMLVWGPFDSGGRYDPASDTWAPMAAANAPLPRIFGQTAVWTGNFLIIWGGLETTTLDSTGGAYCACPGATANYVQDADGDGFGDPDVVVPSCTPPPGYVAPGAGDCDDMVAAVHPGASETCNGRDDNCAAGADEGGGSLCADASTCTNDLCQGAAGCAHPPAPDGVACEDGSGCSVGDTCSAGACRAGPPRDTDGDAHPDAACGGNDCDDADAAVWSGPGEVPRLNLTTAAPATLSWTSLSAAAGPATIYDVAAGTQSASGAPGFASAACLGTVPGAFYVDAAPAPPPGQLRWYLVRGRNGCGVGTYGSPQRDAAIPPCP